MAENRKGRLEAITGIVTVLVTAVALVLFQLSYTTGYYVYGEMNSGLITLLLAVAIVVELAAIVLRAKLPGQLWPKFLTFVVTALLAAAAVLVLGDRVEGIGNCIVTDYDSGHGGEEAIYLSIGASILMLIAMVYNIIGSFERDKDDAKKRTTTLQAAVCGVSALVLIIATVVPTWSLAYGGSSGGATGGNSDGSTASGGTYTVSFNQNDGTAETMPGYQFLCSDFSGMVQADSRFYVDVTLTLDGSGNYTIFSDAYVIEAGARAEIGDDTGLGLILTTTAYGTYTENEDGTITTSAATSATFEMETDTYSAQMKEAVSMNVNGNTEDGVYDSETEPAVLDFVPETLWTLSEDGGIVSYRDANAGGIYTVSFNQNNGNANRMPSYQFLCSDFSGMVQADSRFYVDVTLTLDGGGNYTIFSDAYVIEAGARAEIGDDTGLGLILTTTAYGTYTENEDGTITTSAATSATFEMETDTYSAQMKAAANMNVNGSTEDGVYESSNEPAVLDFIPETVWYVTDNAIEGWTRANAEEEGTEEGSGAEEIVAVLSEDEATSITFYTDGTYRFYFEAYDIEDWGTYTWDGETLTLTDANGSETIVTGDPLEFTYLYSQSDQLTGTFSVEVAALNGVYSASSGAEELLTVLSEDEATRFTFYSGGVYRFYFEAYDIEDWGTYTWDGTTLVLTDGNGSVTTVTGNPLTFTYLYSQSDQLTGTFSVTLADLSVLPAEEGEVLATVLSDDEATSFTFYADGTYRFYFEAYEVEDTGTYSYDGTTLTITDMNGAVTAAEGDPLAFTYAYSQSDALTGTFSVSASALNGGSAEAEELVTVLSDDEATSFTFYTDGTYRFYFEAYDVKDLGDYTWDGETLTITDANGSETVATGDPLEFTYLYSMSDALTGTFSVDAADLNG